MTSAHSKLTRRRLIQLGAAGTAAGLSGGLLPRIVAGGTGDPGDEVDPKDRKLLFVFCAFGGGSIIDSFMPVAETEVGDPDLAKTLNVYPESLIQQHGDSPIRSVKLLDDYQYYATPDLMGRLVDRHGDDMAVMAHEVSSVNHTVGQQRALNGDGVNRGRTIMEAMAMRYGSGMPLPSCNMSIDGYVRHGNDPSVPRYARHEIIAAPLLFASGTHGYRGLAGVPEEAAILRAREIRDKLDERSVFARTFQHSERLRKYLQSRRDVGLSLEQANMIDKLLLLDASQIDSKYDVEPSELVTQLKEQLPYLEKDQVQSQVALGFLMAYYGISTSVALGHKSDPVAYDDQVLGTPLAFDFSHNLHRIVQSIMWGRTATVLDGLITLLKTHDYMGDPELGKMWDRSLIYVATEFGRDKERPSGSDSWGTSHHLNNGSVLISPMLRGNAIYGGVDPKTGLTYGFDPETGDPDPDRVFDEGDVYSVIAQAMGIEFPGRRDFPAIVRG